MSFKRLQIELHVTMLFFHLLLYFDTCATALLPNTNGVTYTWKAGAWGSCSTHIKCGESHRSRKVACQDSDGFVVAVANCDDSMKPKTVQPCFRVCEKHKRVLRWLVGEWSPCIPSTSLSSSTPCFGTAIAGIAHREVNCVFKTTLRTVESSACEYFWDKPENEMACSLDCPQDCVLTQRNISCIPQWCPSKDQWNKEVTDVAVTSSGGGISCPEINLKPLCPVEFLTKKVCKDIEKTQKQYILKIEEWGPCESVNDPNSVQRQHSKSINISLRPVIGISLRNIVCLTDTGNITDLSFCNVMQTPVLSRRCVVPVDCLTSPWSEWRVQEEGCITSDGKVYPETRIRVRRVVQLPVGTGAEPCPLLFEERIIYQDLPSCYKYQWLPVEWSECELRIHGQHNKLQVIRPTCGSGRQYRNLICVRASDMVPVDDKNCKEPRPLSIRRCKVPCRRNCKVSHWSWWGPCTSENKMDFLFGSKTKNRT